MLFITNRALKQSHRSKKNRKIDFDLANNESQQSLFFCERTKKDSYVELTSEPFLDRLRKSNKEQVLLFIHGYSNMPEDAFQRAGDLQSLFDELDPAKVEVVSVVWPCDNDAGIVKDYWDDQLAADSSGFAFGRALERFRQWQIEGKNADDDLCSKRINVLAHSMGNRVFRESMRVWSREILRFSPPMIFRNSFLVAADVVNETLEPPRDGNLICLASRNVVVYYAADDLALRASKVANVANAVASRRLGHTGPENPELMPRNVFAIDCDDMNTHYDFPKGHSYFTFDERGRSGGDAGKVFRHIAECVFKGRVEANQRDATRLKVLGG